MGCCFSEKKKKKKNQVVDTIDEDNEFDYLRPKGRLILKTDSIYNVPKTDILFDDWHANKRPKKFANIFYR